MESINRKLLCTAILLMSIILVQAGALAHTLAAPGAINLGAVKASASAGATAMTSTQVSASGPADLVVQLTQPMRLSTDATILLMGDLVLNTGSEIILLSKRNKTTLPTASGIWILPFSIEVPPEALPGDYTGELGLVCTFTEPDGRKTVISREIPITIHVGQWFDLSRGADIPTLRANPIDITAGLETEPFELIRIRSNGPWRLLAHIKGNAMPLHIDVLPGTDYTTQLKTPGTLTSEPMMLAIGKDGKGSYPMDSTVLARLTTPFPRNMGPGSYTGDILLKVTTNCQ